MNSPTIIQAINDPHLFRPLFKDLGTWASWMTFLKALFALPLEDDEADLYERCTGRETAPAQPFQEAWVPTGRSSGKSYVAALVAVYLATFRDYSPFLSPGERATIAVIAADRRQAGVVFGYIRNFIAANRMLSGLVEAERAESLDLSNRVTIEVKVASFRSIRGPSYAAVICDEIAFWRSEVTDANPSHEVLRAVRPSLGRLPGSLLLCISSPWARTGPLYEAFQRHHGRDDSDVLIWNADTSTMNPAFSRKVIDREMEEDPEAALTEYGAQFRSDLESYLPIEAIEAVIVQGRFEIPVMPGTRYHAFVDPSGGRRDAAALAVAHKEKEKIILDVARSWKAPHDPAQVVGEMAQILKFYGVHRVSGDRYAGEWPGQEFRKHHVTYEANAKDKSGLYLDFLPLVLSGRVELLDLKPLTHELRALERRARTAGRDLVDHPPRGHDDLANAVAGVCARLGTRPGQVNSISQVAY